MVEMSYLCNRNAPSQIIQEGNIWRTEVRGWEETDFLNGLQLLLVVCTATHRKTVDWTASINTI